MVKRRGRSVFLQLEVLTNKDQTKSRDARGQLLTNTTGPQKTGGRAWKKQARDLKEAALEISFSLGARAHISCDFLQTCTSQDVFTQISHMRVLFRIEAKAWLNTVFFSQ